MPRFVAEVEFTFEADSVEAVGAELRRLSQAAQDAGFEMRRGKAVPAQAEEHDSGSTDYVPLINDGP
jgi:hypothetical protein